MIKPNDLVLIQGAGDIHGCVGDLKKLFHPVILKKSVTGVHPGQF